MLAGGGGVGGEGRGYGGINGDGKKACNNNKILGIEWGGISVKNLYSNVLDEKFD